MSILDFGCGSGNLFEVFYRNRFKPIKYLGLDIRGQIIKKNREIWGPHGADFQEVDLCQPGAVSSLGTGWDLVCSFEVVEHIGKERISSFLNNLKDLFSTQTTGLVSTPCYDEKMGSAANHIINGQVGEMTYEEFRQILEPRFKIVNRWGTFASVKDYKPQLSEELKPIYERLHEYYDPNLLACLMAPLFPEHSRNVLWEVTL